MGKNSLPIKIGLLMIIAIILLSATGYLSYRSLSSIVSSIHIDANPEVRLMAIRDIAMDLDKAENSVRMYTITKEKKNLNPYYNIVSGMNKKLELLRTENKDDEKMQLQIDTISTLIKNNVHVWNEMLSLYHDDSLNVYIGQLSEKLATAQNDTQVVKRNLFQRVFGLKKKEIVTPSVNKNELIQDLNKIEKQDSLQNEKLMIKQAKLATTNSEIKGRLYNLITKLETEVTSSVKEKAEAANLLANNTYRWMMLFTIIGTLLTIFVLIIVVRYVRKAHAYQRALEHSREEAENLAKTKELFMANVSHEIRTPVNAISGFSEQLMHKSVDNETARMLKIIKSSSDHLVRTINDILDFSKLQNGKLTLEKTHFNSSNLLDEIQEIFEKQASDNNIKLTHFMSKNTPEILNGDPYRLKQILINLVGNAIKFTSDGEVWFSFDCSSKSETSEQLELIVNVSDTGIGISKDKLDIIFEDFTQAEMSTTRKFGGTGLGLSIVKKLVELHGGRIEVNSNKNKGTEITCYLPYLAGDKNLLVPEHDQRTTIPESIRQMKILIVDDEEYNRQLFKTILERWNVTHKEASDGMEAIELIKKEKFDLVFMDVRMPGIDGLKTTKIFRDDLRISSARMPVISISAACTTDDLKKYEDAGMNAFLLKPFTEEMLLNTILSVLKPGKKNPEIKNEIKDDGTKPVHNGNGQINLRELYHLSGNDPEFVRQMLEKFIDSTEKGLEELNNALAVEKLENLADAAHKISPPCRHVGALTLLDYLKQIEKNAHNQGDPDILKKLVEQSVQEFEEVKKNIHDQITNIS